jgi:hypothetical protein
VTEARLAPEFGDEEPRIAPFAAWKPPFKNPKLLPLKEKKKK